MSRARPRLATPRRMTCSGWRHSPGLQPHVIAEGIQVISEWTSRVPRRRLTCAALAGGTIVTVLAGSTTALAGSITALAAHAAPPGGTIFTVAGGVGGPGPATAISLVSANVPTGACGSPEGAANVAAAAGRL